MNRHEGVSCNHCSKINFTGKRYKCLRCFDYDLCTVCYIANATSEGHSPKHPLQCIICRSDYELYYGGEVLVNLNIPQSLTCPYCARMGFTEVTLKDHVTDKHNGITCQVICPICASASSGDPNFMISDLIRHLTVAHNVESRRRISFSIDDAIHPRIASLAGNLRPRPNLQVIPAVRSARAHGPIAVNHEPSLSSASSSPRDPMDPIDDLILQISRMRRMNNNGALLEHRGRSATWQAMRTEMSENRQQAGRQNLFVIQSSVNVEAPEDIKTEPLPNVPGYAALLPNILNESLSETSINETFDARAQFVKELVYSAMIYETHNKEDSKNSSN